MNKKFKSKTHLECKRNNSFIHNEENEDPSSKKDGFFVLKQGGKKMQTLNPVGVIEDVHGHKGAVRVKPLSENPEKISQASSFFITNEDNTAQEHEIYEIRKYRRNTYLVKFKKLKWRKEVENLVNCMVTV